jgi:acyl carrier protein
MEDLAVPVPRTADAIEEWIVNHLADALMVFPDEIDVKRPFAEYGLDSYTTVRLTTELEEWLGRAIKATVFYDYPTTHALSQHLGSPERST